MTTLDDAAPAPAPRENHRGRGPGRPRHEEIDGQILHAVLELIDMGTPVTAAHIVERSGVGRAAIYRRWTSLNHLIAAALDVGMIDHPPIPTDGDLRQAILDFLTGAATSGEVADYPHERFRHRIRLAMTDPTLQKVYWQSHTTRRRVVLEEALRAGIDRRMLRPDLDVEACFDLIAGVSYYQVVARGERIDSPETQARIHAAYEIVLDGIFIRDPRLDSPRGGDDLA
ncbi:TetR-like C-terminal domain-containing protein [Rhodococcus sp. NPDC057014]|uniref:TetR-like C-terminal domain-containing protein n=1 Tax=Rhodococcus sp. NPDC057014 TaxID=3346000 RepID=UPI0036338633